MCFRKLVVGVRSPRYGTVTSYRQYSDVYSSLLHCYSRVFSVLACQRTKKNVARDIAILSRVEQVTPWLSRARILPIHAETRVAVSWALLLRHSNTGGSVVAIPHGSQRHCHRREMALHRSVHSLSVTVSRCSPSKLPLRPVTWPQGYRRPTLVL